MISSGALRTFARRAASSTTARRFASSGAGAGAGGAESQSAAQQTAAYITAGALVVSMTCVSQAGKKVRTTCMRSLDMCVYFGGVYDMYLSAAHVMLETREARTTRDSFRKTRILYLGIARGAAGYYYFP